MRRSSRKVIRKTKWSSSSKYVNRREKDVMTKEEKKKVRKVVWTSLVKLWLKRICMGLCRSVKRMTKYDLDKESDVALVLLHIWVANHIWATAVGWAEARQSFI